MEDQDKSLPMRVRHQPTPVTVIQVLSPCTLSIEYSDEARKQLVWGVEAKMNKLWNTNKITMFDGDSLMPAVGMVSL
jgi:hypothetical protein